MGKWHLKSQPKGYDKHMVVKGQGKYFDPVFNGSKALGNERATPPIAYTDIAMDWLEKRDGNKPFLLCLQFKAPHHDYGHAARYDNLLADVAAPEPPSLYEDALQRQFQSKEGVFEADQVSYASLRGQPEPASRGNAYYYRHLRDKAPNRMWEHDPKSDKDKIRVAYQHMIHKYVRCVAGNDDNLKRILDYLDQEKLTKDTVVIYTSDQGYWLGQHGFTTSA